MPQNFENSYSSLFLDRSSRWNSQCKLLQKTSAVREELAVLRLERGGAGTPEGAEKPAREPWIRRRSGPRRSRIVHTASLVSRPSDEFALLIEAGSPVRLDLARNLLEEAGIPCVVHTGDFDVAELGVAAHAALRHGDLFVPHAALEEARAVLARAWG
jgi:hypothetical protein